LTHSNCKKLRKGDIIVLVFLHHKIVTILGTIDEVHYDVNDPEKVVEIVSKGRRAAYTKDEIKDLTNKKPITVILFRYHFPLPKDINTKKLIDKKILSVPPQSIVELNNKKYQTLKEETRIPNKYTLGD
jgi:hypothetical protein